LRLSPGPSATRAATGLCRCATTRATNEASRLSSCIPGGLFSPRGSRTDCSTPAASSTPDGARRSRTRRPAAGSPLTAEDPAEDRRRSRRRTSPEQGREGGPRPALEAPTSSTPRPAAVELGQRRAVARPSRCLAGPLDSAATASSPCSSSSSPPRSTYRSVRESRPSRFVEATPAMTMWRCRWSAGRRRSTPRPPPAVSAPVGGDARPRGIFLPTSATSPSPPPSPARRGRARGGRILRARRLPPPSPPARRNPRSAGGNRHRVPQRPFI
jgi:hypothetical protein